MGWKALRPGSPPRGGERLTAHVPPSNRPPTDSDYATGRCRRFRAAARRRCGGPMGRAAAGRAHPGRGLPRGPEAWGRKVLTLRLTGDLANRTSNRTADVVFAAPARREGSRTRGGPARLFRAALYREVPVIRLPLAHGADPDVRDGRGKLARDWARPAGSPKFLRRFHLPPSAAGTGRSEGPAR